MSDEDRELMNKLIEERFQLKKKKNKLDLEIFEIDRRIHILMNIRVNEIDKK